MLTGHLLCLLSYVSILERTIARSVVFYGPGWRNHIENHPVPLEPTAGFEPATSCLQGRLPNHLGDVGIMQGSPELHWSTAEGDGGETLTLIVVLCFGRSEQGQ